MSQSFHPAESLSQARVHLPNHPSIDWSNHPIKASIYPILLLLALIPTVSWAHNGKVALVYPVEKIIIDGDLSDWPDHTEPHPMRMYWGDMPVDAADLQASFRIGYSTEENALFVGLEVRDDLPVRGELPTTPFLDQDMAVLFLDLWHQPLYSPAVLHMVNANERRSCLPFKMPWWPKAFKGYDLCLMSVTALSEVANEGSARVIVALIKDQLLHFRIFDSGGQKIVDMPEEEVSSDQTDTLAHLRNLLTPLWSEATLSESQKQNIVDRVTSIVGHAPFKSEFRWDAEKDRYQFEWRVDVGVAGGGKVAAFSFLHYPGRASRQPGDLYSRGSTWKSVVWIH